jgi:hypothetical protein
VSDGNKEIKVINADGSTSYTTPEAVYDQFVARFKRLTDEELIAAFNRDVGNPGWVSSRASYHSALQKEFERRGFDYSAIGGEHWLSWRHKIKLSGKVIEPITAAKGK